MKPWMWIALAVLVGIPGLSLRLTDTHPGDVATALIFGMAVVGGAFLLSWVSEVAELDIPRSLAISVLAIVAVLPEYAIDVYLAWTAATEPENIHLATANMTGANRLLIGIGWTMVLGLFWLRTRNRELRIPDSHSKEVMVLTLATIYSFSIFIKGYLHIVDTAILGSLFGLYVWMNFKGRVETPELVGPSALMGTLPKTQRRLVVALLFLYSAGVIVLSAGPFVEGLKGTGETLGLSEFLLIQWVAPLASEAPEILLAAIFVFRGRADDGMGLLISSKVNQWTLLVATLPAAFNISLGSVQGMPLDSRQITEFFLTSAQSLFAISIFLDLRISLKEGALLFVLFSTQLLLGFQEARLAFASLYMLLSVAILLSSKENFTALPRLFSHAIGTLRAGSS